MEFSQDNDSKMGPEQLPHLTMTQFLALYRRGIFVENDDVDCIPDAAFAGGVDTDSLDFDSGHAWKSWVEARAADPGRWYLEVVRAPYTGDVDSTP